MILALLPLSLAAAPPFDGETLRWEVRYAGVVAGHAGASARAEGDRLIFEGWAKNADWYAAIYTIDDLVRSTWLPGQGSERYQTWFREGGFHQDQDMRLSPQCVEVWRRQLRDGAWHEWSNRYAASPGAEDPVSALYVLRGLDGAGPWTTPVFTGKRTSPVVIRREGISTVDTVAGPMPADVFELTAPHQGEVEQRGRFLVYLSQDARRLPLRATLATNIGTIRADLVAWTDGAGATWGEAAAAGEAGLRPP